MKFSPPENIKRLIDEQYVLLDKAHSHLQDIWADNILFSFGWWTSLFMTIIPWIIWLIFRNKESSARLLLAGLWAMFISTWLDYVGVTLGLWRCYNKLVPLMPDYIPWDFALMPVTIMFFLQIKAKANLLIKAIIFASMTAFLAEPLFLKLGYTKYPGWNPIFSFPGFLIIYIIAHLLANSKATKPLR
ncbi:hypothetical protein P4654_10330 [Niallia taxi]|uniref:CBO0543 family protein n=1 Tax=Niallia taxi TaxID=2499688 RepID=UPI002E202025|nr:hypothetical protein [Niallia taxi]MED4122065.1 hypothetical protein [Niallia taxi]